MRTSTLVGWSAVGVLVAVLAAYYSASCQAQTTGGGASLERRVEMLAKQVENNKRQIADLRALIESLTLVVNDATKHKKMPVTIEPPAVPSRTLVDTTFMRDELHSSRRELDNLRSDMVHARARLSSARARRGTGKKGAKSDARDWERRVRRLEEQIDSQQVKISRQSREIESIERRNRFIKSKEARRAE